MTPGQAADVKEVLDEALIILENAYLIDKKEAIQEMKRILNEGAPRPQKGK